MIFLDFDGVLFDTVREAYVVAVLTTRKYKTIEEVNFETEHFKNFKKLRYLISPAWNYKYLLEELDKEQSLVRMKDDFIKKVKNVTKKDYENFEKDFFAIRYYLKKEHYEKWFNLNIPFPFLKKIDYLFRDYKDIVFIVTTKDKSTVLKLLSLENIYIDAEHIFDRIEYEICGNKKDIIRNINTEIKPSIFIDDSDKHIKDCLEIPEVKCFQPNWGYTSMNANVSDERDILKEINILLGKKNV